MGNRTLRSTQQKGHAMSQSRTLILALTAVAALASTALIPGSADAMVAHAGRGGPPNIHFGHPHFQGHVRYWHFREHYVRPAGYVRPVVEGICNCLTKDYTPEGTVVFKDLCTKEIASAPVEGAPEQASEAQAPTNFAGKTYQDYLAANPQAQAQQKN
jgi:hypothetical protein